jgi:hypothetical protein
MAFTGKATYSAGASLPEIAEDVADLVAINAPFETPLLDALGDATRPARSTLHEWLEDTLLPNSDSVNDSVFGNTLTDTVFDVANASRFRVGDQIQLELSTEVMLVTAVNTGANQLTVIRGYGGSTATALANATPITILGNAALEGDDAAAARFTARSRKINYTQIFASTVEVSGSELAVRQAGVKDELNYQKQQRTRELLRDLENCVINGRSPAATQEGSSTVRRTMKGLIPFITTNKFVPGVGGFPTDLSVTEDQLNTALRNIWKQSSGQVDLILVGGLQKRAINQIVAPSRRYEATAETVKNLVSIYESDFGVCRIVMSRWVPKGMILFLDSSRIEVLPLAGRSFHFRPLASTGDRESGQVLGEYTLELRNENAHGYISGLG